MLHVGQRVVALDETTVYGNRELYVPAGSKGVVVELHGIFARSASVRYDNGVEVFQPVRKVKAEGEE